MASPIRSKSRAEDRQRARPVPSLACVAAMVALLVVAALTPVWPIAGPLWIAGAVVLLLLAVADLAIGVRADEVEVARTLPSILHVGHDAVATLTVRNLSARPLRVAVAERMPETLGAGGADAHGHLAPGEAVVVETTITGMRRGVMEVPAVGVALRHGLGVLEHRLWIDPADSVRVVPGRPRGEAEWLLARAAVLEEHGQRPVRRIGAGWEFESLREYAVGDELRSLDWKASARRHQPMVRQFEVERHAEVILALDCGRLMGSLIDGVRKLDLAMTPLLDLAAVALSQGERVGLLCFDSRPRVWLPPRAGLARLHQLTTSLAELEDHDDPSSYLRAVTHLEAHHRKRSYVVVFTDFTDEITGREMYATLAALARRHRLVFVAVGDPHLERLVEIGAGADLEAHSREPEAAVFEAATAAQLLVERRRTLERIERMGVPTLDAEPRRLSGRLITRWLALREEGLA